MLSKGFKKALFIDIFLVFFFSLLQNMGNFVGAQHYHFYAIGVFFELTLFFGIVIHWIISIYKRVMHKKVRRNLIIFGALILFWFFARNLKWHAVGYIDEVSRVVWYLYYVPMILLPLTGFFIALFLGKDENYSYSKKWNVLGFIALLFIGIVLTNDSHQLIFSFNENYENWDSDYTYGFLYGVMMFCVFLLSCCTTFIIINKIRKQNKTKKSFLPVLVFCIGTIYVLVYVSNKSIASAFVDLTTFVCLISILFLETCLQIGLIQANYNHSVFFEESTIDAEILNKQGYVLKKTKSTLIGKTVETKMLIEEGFVVWRKDVTRITEMNTELEHLQDELYGDIAFLEEEIEIKEKLARIKKRNSMYNVISTEIYPCMEQLRLLITRSENSSDADLDNALKEINLVSCYVKRKANLLLQIDDNKSISNDDMLHCYYESFRALELIGLNCSIVYKPSKSIKPMVHLLCYDLFEKIVELSQFNIDMIFIHCIDVKDFRFSIEVSKNSIIAQNLFNDFKLPELELVNGEITVYENDESTSIILSIKNKKEEN